MTVIHEEVIFSQGCFRRVRRWIKGWIPNLGGTFIKGKTGDETEVDQEVLVPIHCFMVKDQNSE